ncbi:MAG: thrombospondin type 3 repeat-containing protein [Phycisphaerae bacterium]|nr:thrombospondin type 3 repeat-containing protein [Phycisphaerae bacterium]
MDVYAESFAFVQYQLYDSVSTPWGNARWAFLGGQYTPTAFFDGMDKVTGSVHDQDQQYTIYRANHFLPARAIPTDVTLSVRAEPAGGATYNVFTTVGLEPTGTAKTVRVFTAQVLDHWPATKPYHRNGFKQAVPEQDVVLTPGSSHTVESVLTFDAVSWADPGNIKLIAWAAEPADTGPAAVYQAAVKCWPLLSLPGDEDGDGLPDASDLCPHRHNPLQEDADEDGVGDICDNCPAAPNADQADADEDGIGDICDNCPWLHHVNTADEDLDGVGDVCDSCPQVPAPAGADRFGRSLGTMDLDCDVDVADYVLLADCLGGPGMPNPTGTCDPDAFTNADVDNDGDVDLADYALQTMNFTGPLVSPPLFVGATTCTQCHASQHGQWISTIHATAFDTLVAGGEGNNALCFPCHSVGYGKASGFVDLETTPHLAGIQCENCHGPGSNHVADPANVRLTRDLASTLCGACHQSCHGLCGENHHPQFEQWSTSQHAFALSNIQFEPNVEQACLACHSTEYRLAPPDNLPGVFDVSLNLECAACHNPHGGPHEGQLRRAAHELCAECHSMGTPGSGEVPQQPQAEMLHSTGGYTLQSEPMNGPYARHWWDIPKECAACHVHEEPYGGPQQPVNSGHTFEANRRACLPCHSEATATILIEMTREEIETRLAAIAQRYDPADPLYVDPALIPPPDLPAYQAATFNYRFVQADRSLGAHNSPYARVLLDETEIFFGIPPWRSAGPDMDGGTNP